MALPHANRNLLKVSPPFFQKETNALKTLFPFLKPYRKECVLAPLFKLLEALLELLVPLVMASIIDRGVLAADGGYVLRLGLVLVGLGLLGFGASATAQYFAARAATGFSSDVKSAMFAHIQRFAYADLDRSGSSTLVNRMTTDVNQVQTGVNMVLRLLLRSPFVVFGATIMALLVNVRASLIFLALIPLLALAVAGVTLLTLPRYREAQEKLDRVLLHTRENVTGVRVLRAFRMQNKEIETFEGDNDLLTRLQLHVGRISALTNPLTFILVNAALIVLLQSGAVQVNSGALRQGEMVALVNYLSQILVELVKLANLIVTITKSLASARRLESVFLTEPSMKEPELPRSPREDCAESVRFDHVCARYPGAAADSLSDVSFVALRGQTIGVIGGTGSGKSTLIQLIPRFYDVFSGSVSVNGVDVREMKLDDLRGRIAVVPQNAALFQGTIRDNLRWGKQDATDEELWQALEIAQAAEIVRGKPLGLDEPLEQNGRNLSGGQRQRLTIARALTRKPEILILDDSASALDFATDAALRRSLKESSGDRTVFIISQRPSSIRHADQILVLEDGRLEGIGTSEELLQSCPLYREIYRTQYPEEAIV